MCVKFGLEASNSVYRPNVQRKSIPKFWRRICKRAITKSNFRQLFRATKEERSRELLRLYRGGDLMEIKEATYAGAQ